MPQHGGYQGDFPAGRLSDKVSGEPGFCDFFAGPGFFLCLGCQRRLYAFGNLFKIAAYCDGLRQNADAGVNCRGLRGRIMDSNLMTLLQGAVFCWKMVF